MDIGVGLPTTVPGVTGETVLAWARQADAGPFVSLGLIDRIVYPGYSPLIALAGAAGVTRRVRLVTTVLLAPLYDTAILAKDAASLDALSGGRLTLGLGVGAREDDFLAAGVPFTERGRIFDEQLATMKRVWGGEPYSPDVGPIGPRPVQPGGPPILIGGYSEAAMRRVGKWADGFISGGVPAQMAAPLYQLAIQSWQAAGRTGRPRFVGTTYYALGPHAGDLVSTYIGRYYAFMGDAVQGMIAGIPATPDAIRATVRAFADAGADELICWPCSDDIEQQRLLAGTVA